MSEAVPRVLFVCTGNTCRSPMAEGIFRAMVEDEGRVAVGSAGIAAYGGGSASPETLEILADRGIALDGFRSRMVDEELVRNATHIFCMTRGHLETLEMLFPEDRDKLYLVCEFAQIDGVVGRDVPDPIGGGMGVYREVADCLDVALAGIVAYLRARPDAPAE